MAARGFELGGKFHENPIGSEGRSLSQRKSAKDGPSWTPSEKYKKAQLMNQFRRTGEGPGGNTEAFRSASIWCDCGKHFKATGETRCLRCILQYEVQE